MPESLPISAPWEHAPTLGRLGLALAVGLFVGLERERRGKEAGLRTFGFAALLGALGGLLGDAYALLGLALLGILVVIVNWQTVRANDGAEITTSAASLSEQGRVVPAVAGTGAVLATLASASVNVPLAARGGHRPLTLRLLLALVVIAALGIAGAFGQQWLVPFLPTKLSGPR